MITSHTSHCANYYDGDRAIHGRESEGGAYLGPPPQFFSATKIVPVWI